MRGGQDLLEQRLAPLDRQKLGVVQPFGNVEEVEHHGGRDNGTGERPASDFVEARDGAVAAAPQLIFPHHAQGRWHRAPESVPSGRQDDGAPVLSPATERPGLWRAVDRKARGAGPHPVGFADSTSPASGRGENVPNSRSAVARLSAIGIS